MTNIEILKELTNDVTEEELTKCQYLRNNTFLVDNKHIVQFHEKWSFITCSCLCGRSGFKKTPRYCWHVRSAIACQLYAYYTVVKDLNVIINIQQKAEEEELKKQTQSVKPKKKWKLFSLFHKNN
jgi:hypothetical protein